MCVRYLELSGKRPVVLEDHVCVFCFSQSPSRKTVISGPGETEELFLKITSTPDSLEAGTEKEMEPRWRTEEKGGGGGNQSKQLTTRAEH